METLIVYILKVNISIIILYGFYYLFLRRDTFFQSKRILLLLIYIFSLLYPFINFSFNTKDVGIITQVLTENIPIFTLPKVVVTPLTTHMPEWNIYHLITTIYLTGVIIVLSWVLVQLISIAMNIHQSYSSRMHGIYVNISKRSISPYSFFKWIVIDENTKNNSDLQEILVHEETHAKQMHSTDVLFSQLVYALCWFNPFIWLMNREIRMNLEFLADHSVLKSGYQPEQYQFHLLRLSYQKAAANLLNNFNFSPLKKRIQMMNKKQTSGFGYTKYVLFIPLVAMLLLIGNAHAVDKMDISPGVGEVLKVKTITTTEEATVLEKSDGTEMILTTVPEEVQEDIIFTHVEKMPQFPGGEKEMMAFLYKNLQYPVTAQQQGIQGTATLRFVVGKDGKISNVEVLRSLDPLCDNEAIRVIKLMPDWIPGKQGGKPVSVYYNLPVRYKLNGNVPNKK